MTESDVDENQQDVLMSDPDRKTSRDLGATNQNDSDSLFVRGDDGVLHLREYTSGCWRGEGPSCCLLCRVRSIVGLLRFTVRRVLR
jgi:hypothetical protein